MEQGKKQELMDWLKEIAIAIAIVLLIRYFIFEPTTIFNVSMQPTLYEQNRLFFSKIHYRFGNPKRGDIVLFNYDKQNIVLIKRVIALPGESYAIRNGRVYINNSDEPLIEPYVKETTYIDRNYSYTEGVVPDGYVFVMGDNRNHSEDSREFGYVPIKDLMGKAVVRFWPLNKATVFNQKY